MNTGEVWNVNFSPKVGDEISKMRPAVIVNNNNMGALNLRVVVPVTDAIRSVRDWHVFLKKNSINNLSKDSVADCFQIKSISMKRFVSKRGELSVQEMDNIKIGIMKVLDLI